MKEETNNYKKSKNNVFNRKAVYDDKLKNVGFNRTHEKKIIKNLTD